MHIDLTRSDSEPEDAAQQAAEVAALAPPAPPAPVTRLPYPLNRTFWLIGTDTDSVVTNKILHMGGTINEDDTPAETDVRLAVQYPPEANCPGGLPREFVWAMYIHMQYASFQQAALEPDIAYTEQPVDLFTFRLQNTPSDTHYTGAGGRPIRNSDELMTLMELVFPLYREYYHVVNPSATADSIATDTLTRASIAAMGGLAMSYPDPQRPRSYVVIPDAMIRLRSQGLAVGTKIMPLSYITTLADLRRAYMTHANAPGDALDQHLMTKDYAILTKFGRDNLRRRAPINTTPP
jgi:hypothetical protein